MRRDLKKLFDAEKSLALVPQWIERDSTWLRLTAPLEIEEVAVEGFRFTGTALRAQPDEMVTFQLEYFPPPREKVKGGPICRLEWRPFSSHGNKGRGPREFQHILISGTHIHPFDLNWTDAASAVRRGELPIAVPITPDFQSFEAVLDFVKKEFRIKNVASVPIPPWEKALL